MTSQAGRTVSGQSAGSGQWPEAAGSPPRQGTAGGTAPQSDARSLRWRCGSWGRCGFRKKRNGCARPGRRAPQLRPAPPSPRGSPATSAPRREATALGLRPKAAAALPDVAGVPPPRTPGRGPPGLEEDPLRRATHLLFRDRGHRSGFPRSCSTHSEWVTRLPSAALGNDRGLTAESPPRPTPGRVHRARGLFAAFRHFEGRNGHALPACAFTADRGPAVSEAAPWLPPGSG